MRFRIGLVLMLLFFSFSAVAEQGFAGLWIVEYGSSNFFPEVRSLIETEEGYWFSITTNVQRRGASVSIGKERDGSIYYSTSPNNLYELRTRDDFETIEMIGVEGSGEFPGKTYRRLTTEDIARLEEFGVVLPEDFAEID